ncbi:DUF3626 domain-containing protein [Streptomyces sp. NPDC048191]|uniref:DUF3626 domain-containing protein n=1 Tax=Streptomyces sp. NPDC048191 TaxID=3155484 RepID=UPI00340B7DB4
MDFRQVLPPRARRALDHVAAGVSGPALHPGLRITLNFHPDRVRGGVPILDALARDGAYHSQFVTGTSNGGLTAHPGGDRTRWESRIFGGVYDDAAPVERPLYGALNFRHQVVGAAPRFGSSHLRLAGTVLGRATFCYPDSAAEPTDFGVASAMPLIALAEADEQDPLNDYIESHVHAGVLLARDVEALVLDASYRDTPVEEAARRLPVPLEWHPGYRLTVTELGAPPGAGTASSATVSSGSAGCGKGASGAPGDLESAAPPESDAPPYSAAVLASGGHTPGFRTPKA